jgi:hypothetical protein
VRSSQGRGAVPAPEIQSDRRGYRINILSIDGNLPYVDPLRSIPAASTNTSI